MLPHLMTDTVANTMKTDTYKLGEYKIIESDSGDLIWEAHFGLGEIKEGRCFRKGTILFIGPAKIRRDGFLKLEFMAHLKRFPDWLKTKYYCNGFEVYQCKTGKKVTQDEMKLWMLYRDINKERRQNSLKSKQPSHDVSSKTASRAVVFKLQNYVIEKLNDQIAWKTQAGPNTCSGGTGIILEDILFMGLRQEEQMNLSKRQFLDNLEQLPDWNQTKYYSPKLSLHHCRVSDKVHRERKEWPDERRAAEKHVAKKGHKGNTAFKLTKTIQMAKNAHFFVHWARKWFTCVADWILLIMPILFAYLFGLWKKLKERWFDKSGKRSSSHDKDH